MNNGQNGGEIHLFECGKNLIIKDCGGFDPDLVFDCGQTFRFAKDSDGIWRGVAKGRLLEIGKAEGGICVYGCDSRTFYDVWYDYLGFSLDYDAVRVSFPENDRHLKEAAEVGSGIKILHQDAFETLISFIISQNNNIARISRIVGALCEKYGKRIYIPNASGGFGGSDIPRYAFPTPEELADVDENGYAALGVGYRAPYLCDAVKKVVRGEIDFDAVKKMNTEEAERELRKIVGVGPKVAACILLFGFAKYDAFPIDVWVKRILGKYYGGETPDFGSYAGIAQQYLFYYERYISAKEPKYADKITK
jgi:N-glycosylase/DNA lyase